MAIALTPEKRFDYVLKADRELPPEQQTIWHLRALTVNERDKIVGQLTHAAKFGKEGFVAAKADAIRCGLDGWTNFADANGNQAQFEGAAPKGPALWIRRQVVITEGCLELIPYEYWDELADAIIECQHTQEADRKN